MMSLKEKLCFKLCPKVHPQACLCFSQAILTSSFFHIKNLLIFNFFFFRFTVMSNLLLITYLGFSKTKYMMLSGNKMVNIGKETEMCVFCQL